MPPLASIDFGALWEAAYPLAPLDQTRVLVAAASPGVEPDALPLGTCHAHLIDLYLRVRGAQVPCEARCPACAEQLEFTLSAHALAQQHAAPEPVEVEYEGTTYTFRPPTLGDLRAALVEPDAVMALAARCLAVPAALPEAVVVVAEARLAEADPLALVALDLVCPACGTAWQDTLDLRAFVLHGLEAEAHRFVYDVQKLARAYGWTEGDVRALTPWRRQQYLAWAEA